MAWKRWNVLGEEEVLRQVDSIGTNGTNGKTSREVDGHVVCCVWRVVVYRMWWHGMK